MSNAVNSEKVGPRINEIRSEGLQQVIRDLQLDFKEAQRNGDASRNHFLLSVTTTKYVYEVPRHQRATTSP